MTQIADKDFDDDDIDDPGSVIGERQQGAVIASWASNLHNGCALCSDDKAEFQIHDIFDSIIQESGILIQDPSWRVCRENPCLAKISGLRSQLKSPNLSGSKPRSK